MRPGSGAGKLDESPAPGPKHAGDDNVTVKKKKKAQRKPSAAKKVKAPSQQLSSPELFFQRLHARLAALGLDRDEMDTKTSLDSPPPCFALRESSYTEWLAAAVISEPPLRADMPAEPNYCRDCTSKFRRHAIKAGACLFPHMRLVRQMEFGEKLMVGQTHSRAIGLREFGPDPDLVDCEGLEPRPAR